MKRTLLATTISAFAALAPAWAQAADAKIVAYFEETCGVCHGDKGQGIANLAPPLKGSKFVTGASAGEIGETITKGRAGDQKRYKEFASPMPAQTMSDTRLAGLIAYLKDEIQK